MSLFVWYFGTRRQYPEVAHHTISLGPRYRGLLDDIFTRKHLADDFSLYLHRPTATDPSLAPPGCDTFYVLSPVPHLDAGIDWRERAEPYRAAIDDIGRLPVALPDGGSIPLAQLATVTVRQGPTRISREAGVRMVHIKANLRGRDQGSFVAEAQQRVAQAVHLPPGYSMSWGGQFENQQRAAQRLGMVVPVALLLIFFLLFSTFGSVRQAALVLSNVPLALIGGIAALAVTGEYLSVPASVGFIALLGIAVLNGVVMVSYFNQLIEEGRSPREAVWEGAQRRLRPVLMTAAITAGGLIPLLFATGPGSEIQKPLAIVVTGGLLSSTALTLLLLPMAYERFGVRKEAA